MSNLTRQIPLLFTTENRALVRQGLKTETRRGMRLRKFPKMSEFKASQTLGYDFTFRDRRSLWNDLTLDQVMECSPYGNSRTENIHYWMKEPVQVLGHIEDDDYEVQVKYLDDGVITDVSITDTDWIKLDNRKDKYAPSTAMFMLKSFARTWLRGVRVWPEQLGKMSEESALAEGIQRFSYHPPSSSLAIEAIEYGIEGLDHLRGISPTDAYRRLWESINGAGSWDDEKWVWCIKFESPRQYPS